jgi:serine/threonine-protein kinase 24/25/MST4
MRKLVYKLANACKEIDRWEKEELDRDDVDVSLEELLEAILVIVDPGDEAEG